MKLLPGLSLFTLMRELKEDYFRTLEKIRSLGLLHIEYVEFPESLSNIIPSPKEIGRKVKELGMVPISSHVDFHGGRDLERIINDNAYMGVKQLVMPFATMFCMEDVKHIANTCQAIGIKCKEYGMTFCYHNHFQEFVKIDGKYAIEWLTELTDPSLVGIEMDTYWTVRGGEDPINLLEKLGSRCVSIHQKDLSSDVTHINILNPPLQMETKEDVMNIMERLSPAAQIVPIGTGCIDLNGICNRAAELGFARHIIIELDSMCRYNETDHGTGPSPLEAIAMSFSSLKRVLANIVDI